MLNPIKLEFDTQANRNNIDRTVKYLTIKSRDINTILFEIAFKGITLDETYTVGLLAVFGNGNQANYVLEIKEGKALYKPDVGLIGQYDTVKNYVYLQQGNKSLDVKQFNHRVELSELDKRASVTRKIYDQNYSDLITTFEHSLNDYKESLPQGSELRSEVDAILDKFKSAEENRKTNEEKRREAEIARQQAELDRQAQEEARDTAEGERDTAEGQRVADHANRSAEFDGKADKVVIKNLIENGNFESASPIPGNTTLADGFIEFTGSNTSSRFQFRATVISGHKYYTTFKVKYISDKPTFGAFSLTGFGHDFQYHSTFGEPNSWSILSAVIESSHDTHLTFVYLQGTAQYDDFIIIDLTETFGAGNEPTKEEMDELIKVTGYIDEEYALNNKEMLIWTLALIRRNKNAIIALGGMS